MCAGLTHWQHPRFFAYFPTASTFEGMLGDLLASSTANPGFNVGVLPSFSPRSPTRVQPHPAVHGLVLPCAGRSQELDSPSV